MESSELDPMNLSSPSLANGLLYFEIILFAALTSAVGHQAYKVISMGNRNEVSSAPVSVEGTKSRKICFITLLIASLARTLSLMAESFLAVELDSTTFAWFSYLVRTFPALLFLTTYSVVILFFCQIHHAASMTGIPILQPIWLWSNIVVYVIYFGVALNGILRGSIHEFRQLSFIITGVLCIIVGFLFYHYGTKVHHSLCDRSRGIVYRRQQVVQDRINLLRLGCPPFLLVRGLYCLSVGVRLVDHYYPAYVHKTTWDFAVFVLAELVPSAIILKSFWYQRRGSSSSSSSAPSHLQERLLPASRPNNSKDNNNNRYTGIDGSVVHNNNNDLNNKNDPLKQAANGAYTLMQHSPAPQISYETGTAQRNNNFDGASSALGMGKKGRR